MASTFVAGVKAIKRGMEKLTNTLRHMGGEILITHLGLDYYDEE